MKGIVWRGSVTAVGQTSKLSAYVVVTGSPPVTDYPKRTQEVGFCCTPEERAQFSVGDAVVMRLERDLS